MPSRSALPRHVGGAEWAVNDFQQQAASIAGQLAAEFRSMYEKGELDGTSDKEDGTERAGIREGSSTRKTEAEERSECKV